MPNTQAQPEAAEVEHLGELFYKNEQKSIWIFKETSNNI